MIEPPFVTTAPIAFIASIGEPPPTAIKKSQSFDLKQSTPLFMIRSVGSEFTSSKIMYLIPKEPSMSVTSLTLPSLTINWSVTIKACLPKAAINSFAFSSAFSP